MIEFTVNGVRRRVDVQPDTPLLWVLRDELGLTGTKFGCGIGQCGACTVHLRGQPVRTCIMPISAVVGAEITTIEGLSAEGDHPVQRAWVEHSVPQCGYCQSGQVMAAAALLAKNPNPSDSDIDRAMTNICRCGTYVRIRRALHSAAALQREAALQGEAASRSAVASQSTAAIAPEEGSK
jgi:aerobic-type carbon monoxide dehydrogenase small subunit (CoxS/CutS family)